MKNILACIDGSLVSQAICDAAGWASKKLNVPVEILHVLDKEEYESHSDLSGNLGFGARENLMEELVELDEKRSKIALKQAEFIIEKAVERTEQAGAETIISNQQHGYFVQTALSREQDTRLLVIGRRGKHHELTPFTIGKHLSDIIRASKRNVLVTLPEFKAPKKGFVLAFDGSEHCKKNINTIIESPLLQGLECHIIKVAEESEHRYQQLEKAKEKLEQAGFTTFTQLLQGETHYSIHNYLRRNELELIVMGAYGHSRFREFFVGSNTTRVVSTSDVPILILR